MSPNEKSQIIDRTKTIAAEILYDDERCRCLENAIRSSTEDAAVYVVTVVVTELQELLKGM